MFHRPDAWHQRLLSSGWFFALWFLLLTGSMVSRAQVALDPELAQMPVIERIVSAPVFEEPLTWVGDEVPDLQESRAPDMGVGENVRFFGSRLRANSVTEAQG